MDSRWFREDRELPKAEQAEARIESEKALKNSTLFQRRLERIVDEMIDTANRAEEDFSQPNWQFNNVANISRRKTLREIKQLIQLK